MRSNLDALFVNDLLSHSIQNSIADANLARRRHPSSTIKKRSMSESVLAALNDRPSHIYMALTYGRLLYSRLYLLIFCTSLCVCGFIFVRLRVSCCIVFLSVAKKSKGSGIG